MYGPKLKVPFESARVKLKAYFWEEGSVLAGTLQTGCDGFELDLEIKSDAPAEDIARLIKVCERGCFVMQTLIVPSPVTLNVTLNGEPLPMD